MNRQFRRRALNFGGWPSRQVEEFYVLTWEGKKEQIFEMPVRVTEAVHSAIYTCEGLPGRDRGNF